MWADNDTDVDLLGFDYLVDTLFVALTQPRLLPLTVGLLGDWGSGKSSLMRITRAELTKPGAGGAPSRYVCVEFSPWQYEDYDDVKVALMSAVLEAIEVRVEPEQQVRVSSLRKLAKGLNRWGRRGGRVAVAGMQAAAPLALVAHDPSLGPEALKMAEASLSAVAGEATKMLEDPKTQPAAVAAPVEPVIDAGRFRREFTEVVAGLRDVDAVVVFIDDLDRCLPWSVVDTFEAIRLFLNTPKTAYVVAANQAVVEAAIDSRYPDVRRGDGTGIGADYLEKMLQLKVAIPTLSAPEADTYMNLLLAELHLASEQFARILEETRRNRATGNLQVSFNLGVATTVLGTPPAELVRDLEWAASIADLLGVGLRGNPRQLKRFLNNLLVRHHSARRRNISLELPVLAKLMVLEEQYVGEFQRLFDWQLGHAGPILELAEAESLAVVSATTTAPKTAAHGVRRTDEETTTTEQPAHRRPNRPARPEGRSAAAIASLPESGGSASVAARLDDEPTPIAEDVRAWAGKEHVAAWLRLEPPLAGVDLRPYFTYSRDKLTLGISASRLAPHLQGLLTGLQNVATAARRTACTQIGALPAGERAELVDAFVDSLTRRPNPTSLTGAVELAERAPDTLPTIGGALLKVPASAVPLAQAAAAVQRLPADDPTVSALFDRWENSGVKGFKEFFSSAREARRRGGKG